MSTVVYRYNMLERRLWAWKSEGNAPPWIHAFPHTNAANISNLASMTDDHARTMELLMGEHGYALFRTLVIRVEQQKDK